MAGGRAKSQPETERAKHPAKVLTVTVDAALDYSSVVILRSVPDSILRSESEGSGHDPDSLRACSEFGGGPNWSST